MSAVAGMNHKIVILSLMVSLLSFLCAVSVVSAFPSMVSGDAENHTVSNPHQGMNGMNISAEDNVTAPGMHKPVILQYLIEVGGSSLEDFLTIRETLVFKNLGLTEYNESLGAVIPPDATGVRVSRFGHQVEGNATQLGVNRSGSDLKWRDVKPLAPQEFSMYVVEYSVPVVKRPVYLKVLRDDVIDFPVGELLIKITRKDVKPNFKTGTGVALTPDNTQIREDGAVYVWSPPRFEKIAVELIPDVQEPVKKETSSTSNSSSAVFFVLIGVIVVLLVAYPLIKEIKSKK